MTTNTDRARPELPEPESYRREWDGDDSDLGSYVHADSKDELDNLPLEPLYTADQMREYLRAAIQQAAGAVPEGLHKSWDGYQERCSHGVRWENRCTSCASPSPPKQQPVHLVGGEGGGITQPTPEGNHE